MVVINESSFHYPEGLSKTNLTKSQCKLYIKIQAAACFCQTFSLILNSASMELKDRNITRPLAQTNQWFKQYNQQQF